MKLRKMLDSDYQIILVGLAPEQKAALPEGIIGITRTNNVNELRKLYAIADVFVNPTYEDNFPTTNIEALACGTPIITYQTGGSPEIVKKCGGFVIKQGNVLEIVSKCRNLKKSEVIIDSNFVSKENDNLMVVRKYIKLYE